MFLNFRSRISHAWSSLFDGSDGPERSFKLERFRVCPKIRRGSHSVIVFGRTPTQITVADPKSRDPRGQDELPLPCSVFHQAVTFGTSF